MMGIGGQIEGGLLGQGKQQSPHQPVQASGSVFSTAYGYVQADCDR